MVGPDIQNDLSSIIIRFRVHTYLLKADIAKMYRHVILHPDDRKYQKILWRENRSLPIKSYELNTITYNITLTSFLAIRTLEQLADDEGTICPEAAEILLYDFYIEDLITGTHELATKIRD
ncbi:uncharacterized protein LOC124949446 [Vespa velutina]|uniref:uncharacterized protein LOC124949446 n=1 Tax=Vespa velutina TaxID=202808 RepID=UPI001FB2B464|nr:uncharacterized protein LOC124949446 [Vespa velutina]